METFFDIMTLILFFCFLIYFHTMSKRIESIEEKCSFFQRKFLLELELHSKDFDRLENDLEKLFVAIDSLTLKIEQHHRRSTQAILERLDAAKPIKPNNWDSVKEAFKAPARINLNE